MPRTRERLKLACYKHPKVKAHHVIRDPEAEFSSASGLVISCCECYLATGCLPSPFHDCRP